MITIQLQSSDLRFMIGVLARDIGYTGLGSLSGDESQRLKEYLASHLEPIKPDGETYTGRYHDWLQRRIEMEPDPEDYGLTKAAGKAIAQAAFRAMEADVVERAKKGAKAI